MTKDGNLRNKEKCKRYKSNGTREKNKAKRADKLKKHLAKCAERHRIMGATDREPGGVNCQATVV